MNLLGFHSFRWEFQDERGVLRDYAIVFKAPGFVQNTSYAEMIEEVCKGPVQPDAVVFLYLKNEEGDFFTAIQSETVSGNMLRFNERLPCVSAGLDLQAGQLSIAVLAGPTTRAATRKWETLLKANLESWLQKGLQEVFPLPTVLTIAPSGFEFVKHGAGEQKRSKIFLRAEQGLTTTARVSFVAVAIWMRLLMRSRRSPTISTVFIDTMGIASIAYALRDVSAYAGSDHRFQIESFHSYGSLESIKIGERTGSLCLISASTSMDMHRRWVTAHQVEPSQCITILTGSGAADSRYALLQLELPRSEPLGDSPYTLRIEGESFLPVLEAPKLITLNVRHVEEQAAARLRSIYDSGIVRVYGGVRESNPTKKGIYVDRAALADWAGLRNFVQDQIDQFGFSRAGWIVYQADEGSVRLAELVRDYLSLPQEQLLASVDVPNHQLDAKALIVVASAVGQGSDLLAISRDLRGRHSGSRLYLIGVQVALLESSIDVLRKNLEKSGGERYRVTAFCSLAIGAAAAESFDAEIRLRDKYVGIAPPLVLDARIADLRRARSNAPNVGLLPCGSNLERQMTLRPGFVFWSAGYTEGPWVGPVLGTVASVLQHAREASTLPAATPRLSSSVIGQVCLDPENFSRFNDAIIQSCLLRAALAHELDYRSISDASRNMTRFLIRMFRDLSDINSESVLEFLSALATRRLQLMARDLEELLEHASAASANAVSPLEQAVGYYVQVIRFELVPAYQADAQRHMSPF